MSARIPSARARLLGLCVVLLPTGGLSPLKSEPFPIGKSEREVLVGETIWRVHAFKPDCYREGPLIIVFHGSDRNPSLARNNAVAIAHAGCAVVVAPLFEYPQFRWAYHFGGLGELVEVEGRKQFRIKPDHLRTGYTVLQMIEALRGLEGRPGMSYSLIGHSAGAQFLGRFAAFYPNEARRIVLANAGSYLVPSWDHKYPYGFGGLTFIGEADRRRYLRSPITILLASEDIRREGLDKSDGAERQGSTRYERGHATFQIARAAAASEGLIFRWSLAEAQGLGHGSAKLYARSEAIVALFGPQNMR